MQTDTTILITMAMSIGFFHTLFGPDHYLPFIVMSKARKWSMLRTILTTIICGLGHVLSSVVLGFVGVILGVAVFKLEMIESFRGDLAGWILLVFGFTYFVWGIHQAVKNKPHKHTHIHDDGNPHEHLHVHNGHHLHVHKLQENKNITPWILFTIFIFGPCEPLIPILMYPAAKGSFSSIIAVTTVFSITTILTMLTMVIVLTYGLKKIPFRGFQRYSHALAGFVILFCGVAIKFLGL